MTTATVAMDASALMTPVECDVRVFEELDRLLDAHEPVVPAAVLAELEKLSDGGGREATAAAVGRDLADRCRPVETEESYADDALTALAATGTVDYVATNDRALRDRLLDAGARVIGLRGRDKLAVTRP